MGKGMNTEYKKKLFRTRTPKSDNHQKPIVYLKAANLYFFPESRVCAVLSALALSALALHRKRIQHAGEQSQATETTALYFYRVG